jgi:non-ribosomal peptide synthetase component E (peptide arylation enzyme)
MGNAQARRADYEAQGLWPGRTLADAFDIALERTPDKLLVVTDTGVRLTYREVADQVARLETSLRALGIGHGDVISVQLPNRAEFVVIHLAATRVGAVTNPLLPLYRAKELRYILGFAATKLVFIPGRYRNFDYPALYGELAGALPLLDHVCVVGEGGPPDMLRFADLLEAPPSPPQAVEVDGNDTTILLFTSGTEASPKGVIHTHNTLMYGNITMPPLLGLTSDEVIWAVSPIAHAAGLEWGVRQAIVLGGTVVLQDQWDVEAALDLIEREGCTFSTAATAFPAMLLDSPSIGERDLSRFRTFLCGGAAIPSTLGAAMMARLGCNLIPCWGMSECFAATMGAPADPADKRWGTDGRALPGSEIAIFDETRTRQLPAGQEGEIATRGPHVCLGYFNDPERTAETFSDDGWLFSNDLGTLDENGYLRVVGRKKDIINRGGLKISAGEIEELLARDPRVRAVAVIAVPDAKLGEKSCACIIPSDAGIPTLDDLVATLKDCGIANYKLPEYLAVLDAFPTTPTGKTQKFKLREGLLDGSYPMVSR